MEEAWSYINLPYISLSVRMLKSITPMTNENQPGKNTAGFLNVVVLILSVYVLLALLIDTFFKLPAEISRMLNFIDNIICIIFLLDFSVRLHRSENKWQFMKWGWIDLVSSIPNIDILRAGRTLRLIRILRILRAFRSTRHLVQHIFKKKVQGTIMTAALIAFLMLIFSSIAILQFETSPESNIKTAEDALWWSFSTITTVGYGDRYPVTIEGRIIAMLLMTAGVGLFGTFTAFVASWFVRQSNGDTQSSPGD